MTQALHPTGSEPEALVLGHEWAVRQALPNGEMALTLFIGPWAAWRARQYARALTVDGETAGVEAPAA